MKTLIDIGANLCHDSLMKRLDDVLEHAQQHNVTRMIVTGSDMASSEQALLLAQQYKNLLFATSGIHPHHAGTVTKENFSVIADLAKHADSCAVGETGLDFNRDFSPRPDQERVFEQHIELAIETGKPLFLHERDAFSRFHPIIKQYRDQISDAVVHCFTGEKEALYAYLDLDLHIGITGWLCDERRGQHLLPLIAEIPNNRLMIETDAPYLLPRNIRPKPKSRTNEPAFLPWIVQKISECTGETIEQIAEQTTRTTEAFFRLNKPA
ncbi:MAG: TatD family hydrolase [Pseudomonadales bacterium]|nr:TatD family hydrolase [Pseudomonadales bacterium]